MRERVLLVQRDVHARDTVAMILGFHAYRCTSADDAVSAREWLARAPFDLILCDVRLPDGSGVQLVETALQWHKRTGALMLADPEETSSAERALDLGAHGYVLKPIAANELLVGVRTALEQRNAPRHNHAERRELEEPVRRLCVAAEARDPEAAPHIHQMSEHCWHIARALGMSAKDCELIRRASQMHDVGNLAVPDELLMKPAEFTPEERRLMERHTEIGHRMLAGSRLPLLRAAATIAWTHHERYDGSGYPRGVAGTDIPLEGRIAAVADVFDALTRQRPHRDRLPREEALAVLEAGRGSDFDPQVLDTFLAYIERLPSRPLPRLDATGDIGAPPCWLTRREQEVLQLAADGHSVQAIAELLVVSMGTVKTHFQNIYSKLGARNRASAVAHALRHGLIV